MSAVTLPVATGIGLRAAHGPALAEGPAPVPWLEIHSENYLCDGGPRLALLDAVAARYPISCHAVGLSLGAADGPDPAHVAHLKNLFARVNPAAISDHLSWSAVDGTYLNDLLPLPYNAMTLAVVADNIARVQDTFGCRILVENPSSYLTFAASSMPEPDFLAALVARTGCGLLLDVNNIHVSAANTGIDARAYFRALPPEAVGEIHVAGHTAAADGSGLLIDTHAARVSDAVWELYRAAIAWTGPRPTLVEWDAKVPALSVLLAEAARAQDILQDIRAA